MKRILLPILVISVVLLGACGAPTTAPPTEAPPPTEQPAPTPAPAPAPAPITTTPPIEETPAPAPAPAPTQIKTEFKAVCGVPAYNVPEFATYEWFIDEAFKRTEGRLQIELRSLSLLMIHRGELTRALRTGVLDFGELSPSELSPLYTGETIPVKDVDGVMLPGLFDDWDKTTKAHKAWHVVLKQYQKDMGGVFLGSVTYHNEYLYCRSEYPVEELSRCIEAASHKYPLGTVGGFGWNHGLLSFLDTFGAVCVNLPHESQLYEAFEEGVANKVFIGSSDGYTLKLYDIAEYLVDLQLGTKFGALVVGQKFWDELPDDLKAILIELGAEFTERGFTVAQEVTLDGLENNKKAGMVWVPTKAKWMPTIKEVVKTKVVPDWIERSSPEAKNLFNDFLAPYAGFTIP